MARNIFALIRYPSGRVLFIVFPGRGLRDEQRGQLSDEPRILWEGEVSGPIFEAINARFRSVPHTPREMVPRDIQMRVASLGAGVVGSTSWILAVETSDSAPDGPRPPASPASPRSPTEPRLATSPPHPTHRRTTRWRLFGFEVRARDLRFGFRIEAVEDTRRGKPDINRRDDPEVDPGEPGSQEHSR
jgi:hypothetical protein